MDVATAFVLSVVIYTGKAMYGENKVLDKIKTVQMVVVEPFVWLHRTIYVDRFYPS